MSKVQMAESWLQVLSGEFQKDYMKNLKEFLKAELQNGQVVYPKSTEVFRAFQLTPFEKVKAVILGQDPYHGKGQAHGLSFSVPTQVPLPPSLKNIYKEIQQDLKTPSKTCGDLSFWAEQGVLLLNATLSVRAGQAGSHQNKGWEIFTDQVLVALNKQRKNLVFLLWGSFAKQKAHLVDSKKHLVLRASHPSPFSADRGFFGCRHFSKVNEYLLSQGQKPIDW